MLTEVCSAAMREATVTAETLLDSESSIQVIIIRNVHLSSVEPIQKESRTTPEHQAEMEQDIDLPKWIPIPTYVNT